MFCGAGFHRRVNVLGLNRGLRTLIDLDSNITSLKLETWFKEANGNGATVRSIP